MFICERGKWDTNSLFIQWEAMLPLHFKRLGLIRAATSENRSSGFPTRSHTNQAAQPQKMARGLKFCISVGEGGLYYPCSENKGADQLRGYQNPVFSRRGSYYLGIKVLFRPGKTQTKEK